MKIPAAPELLAPVGSVQSFFAALENGADAVFCGLKRFSARARARNFTLDELAQLTACCHSRSKKIYVALNTLAKELELAEIITILSELSRLRIDGLILQDLGVYRIARNFFPEIPLHASTQMVVHSLAGARCLERLGFERVVLARELSLSEISHISQNSSIEIEHFIHGALCYSMSGHCLFSSYIDGRSGNRGRCIQPCRRRYHHNGNSGFCFSTNDFSALELIPRLQKAGVMSLKIEGRMKSAEYVASVVGAYRTVLDSTPGQEQDAIAAARERLEGAMGRRGTVGFLSGMGGSDIVHPGQKGGIGKVIGRVKRLQGRRVFFTTSEAFFVGDRLRIQPGNDRDGQGFTVRELFLGKRAVKRVSRGDMVSLPLPVKTRLRAGDVVFKLGSGKGFTMSEEACRRRLRAAAPHAFDVDISISCAEKTSQLLVQGRLAGTELVLTKEYFVDMIAADRSPLGRDALLKLFSHTGQAQLNLGELTVGELPAVVVKPSRLKAVRREFYASFNEHLARWQADNEQRRLQRIRENVVEQAPSSRERENISRLYIETDDIREIAAITDSPDHFCILPIGKSVLKGVKSLLPMEQLQADRLIVDIPSIIFEAQWEAVSAMVRELADMGFVKFRLNNLAHFELFRSMEGLELMAGPWLYGMNSQSVQALIENGCGRFSFALEDDRENIFSLLERVEGRHGLLTVYGRVDLFSSRIAFPAKEKRVEIRNDRGDLFLLERVGETTVTRAAQPFSLLGHLRQLRQKGCCNFVLDLKGVGFTTSAGQKIVDAYHRDQPLPDTMELNYSRGLQ